MEADDKFHVCYGDLHNYCGISYAHEPLEEALANAREQLDFCSVTGQGMCLDVEMPLNPKVEAVINQTSQNRASWVAGFQDLTRTITA